MAQNARNAFLRNSAQPKLSTIINFTNVFESAAIKMLLTVIAESPPDFAILAIESVIASTSVILEISPAI